MKRAIETVRSEVEALNPDEVKEVTVEISLAVHNAELAIEALEPHEELLRAIYRQYVSAAILLRILVDALREATQEVEEARPIPTGARELGVVVYADRAKLLAQLTTWALLGSLPQREVDRIREGRGQIDACQDVLAMVVLINRSTDLKKRSQVTQDALAEMKARAQQLLTLVRPADRRRRVSVTLTKALDTQARVWTLFVRQHDLLWQDAVRIFGRQVDEHVPALGSRVVSKRKAKRPAEPVI